MPRNPKGMAGGGCQRLQPALLLPRTLEMPWDLLGRVAQGRSSLCGNQACCSAFFGQAPLRVSFLGPPGVLPQMWTVASQTQKSQWVSASSWYPVPGPPGEMGCAHALGHCGRTLHLCGIPFSASSMNLFDQLGAVAASLPTGSSQHSVTSVMGQHDVLWKRQVIGIPVG